MATTAAMQLQLLPNNGLSSFCGSKSCAPLTSVHLLPAHLLPAGRREPCYMASPSPSMVSQLELSSVGRNLNLGLQRKAVRLGLPSKGRMAEGTLALLKECQLSVRKPNPRQYVADIPELKNLEVWFQREADVVRKILSGDVDLGIVGYDVVVEHGEENEDLLVLHDALGFGECYLALGIPTYGIFGDITSVEELAAMPQWTADRPLRIVTGFTNLGQRYLQEKGFKHVKLSTADGALEAAPAMGTADAILDLVSSGTTLRENNLKEIEGGKVMSSQGVLIASRKALLERPGALEAVHEMLERLDAHLRARDQFLVTANMRGDSAEDVASRVLKSSQVSGLQGPTVSPVYSQENSLKVNYFAVSVCVNKKDLYSSVKNLRGMSGSGVLVAPLTYIFEEESPRWRALLEKLNK